MAVELKVHVEPLPVVVADDVSPEAFEALYRRCHGDLVWLCRRMLGGTGDPEAVAQEAFVRAWTSLDRFSAARPFWPWLATIARRLCIDQRRRLERDRIHGSRRVVLPGGAPALTPEEEYEADEENRSASEALRRLKPKDRRVIVLRDVQGWSYEEIARFEGVTVESVRGSLKRARVSLRKSYASVVGSTPTACASFIVSDASVSDARQLVAVG